MVRALASLLSRWSARWVPDPFVIAVLLTLATVGLVWGMRGVDPLAAVGLWGGRLGLDGALLPGERGLFKLLAFAMQVCLTLVTGHALASAPPVRRGVARVAAIAHTPRAAVALTAVTAMLAGYLNWALGLIVGALLARDMGRSARERGLAVHYPLLGAAGYTGLLVWHGGLSGTAPLKVTRASEIRDIMPGVALEPIPLGETLFSPMNLALAAALLVAVPLLLALMHPGAGDCAGIDRFTPVADPPPAARPARPTPARWLEHSRAATLLLAALAGLYLVRYVATVGVGRLDLNTVNLAFLTGGLLLHPGARSYLDAVTAGARGCAGVILQFPLYAGIMGLMSLSGLVGELASGLAATATPRLFGPLTFLAAGLVNLFVPSGGGQWAIQGPIVIGAARRLGVPRGKAVMAFCYGDQWTNMLQPFWALPLLGITGLPAGEIIGYSGTLMLLVSPLFAGALLLF